MPSISKSQQQAAGIALKAKREGKVDKLPNGAAKNMAKSMSEKELVKLAQTKQKGLPKNVSENSWDEEDNDEDDIRKNWEEDADEQYQDYLEREADYKIQDKIETDIQKEIQKITQKLGRVLSPDEVIDIWDKIQMDYNVIDEPTSFKQREVLKKTSAFKRNDDFDPSFDEGKQWAQVSLVEVFKEEMLGVSTEEAEEEQITTQKSKTERLGDRETSTGKDVEDTWASVAGGKNPALASHSRSPMSSNTTGARVSEQTNKEKTVCSACGGTGLKDGHGDTDGMFQSPAMCPKCKGTGKIEDSIKSESININRWKRLAGILSEQQTYEEYDWDEADSYHSSREGASAEAEWERIEQKKWDVLQTMRLHLNFHWKNYQTSPDSWDPEDLVSDVSELTNVDELSEEEMNEVAQEAIELEQQATSSEKPYKENVNPNSLDLLFEQELNNNQNTDSANGGLSETFNVNRWKKLAGLLSERLHPENIDAAKKYTEQLITKGWSWDKIKDSLVNSYGYSLYDVDKIIFPHFQSVTKVSEAMEGGASNSAPNPGHKAKLNQA